MAAWLPSIRYASRRIGSPWAASSSSNAPTSPALARLTSRRSPRGASATTATKKNSIGGLDERTARFLHEGIAQCVRPMSMNHRLLLAALAALILLVPSTASAATPCDPAPFAALH